MERLKVVNDEKLTEVAGWLTNISLHPIDSCPSYDDHLDDKREDYQNCSVLYCTSTQLYHMSSSMAVDLGLVSFVCVFCVFLTRLDRLS